MIEEKLGDRGTTTLCRKLAKSENFQQKRFNNIRIYFILRREINPSQNYTRMQIQALVELSEYSKQKPFEQLTSEYVSSFLFKFRKTEDRDPLHKWIGTYNLKHEILRFH